MKYLIKLVLRKEKWVVVLFLLSVLLASLTTLGQAVLAANLLNSSLTTEQIIARAQDAVAGDNLPADSLTAKVVTIFKLVVNEGNEAATRYVIEQGSLGFLLVLGLILLLVLSFTQVMVFFKNILMQILSLRIAIRIRRLIFNRLIDLPTSYFRIQESGGVVYRLTEDARVIETSLFTLLENGFFGPILSLLGLAVLVYIDYRLTLVIFLNVIVTVLVIHYVAKVIRLIARRLAEGGSNINTHIYKVFSTIAAVKSFCRERWEKRKYDGLLQTYLKDWFRLNIITGLVRPASEIIGLVGVVVIIFYGTILIWRNEFTSQGLFTFLFILFYIVPYFQRLSSMSVIYSRLDVSVRRVLDIINSDYEAKVFRMGHSELTHYTGQLEFRHVNFDYRQESTQFTRLAKWGLHPQAAKQKSSPPVMTSASSQDLQPKLILNDISFKVHAGESIGLVGESGSGKTTLVNLIALFMVPLRGTILWDGAPVTHYTLKSIRQRVSMVTQETYLFNDSILENVRYGRLAANQKDVRHACQLANIDEFIMSLPAGYQTKIGERGVKLSGGQKQRISLARAILKPSKILILDEATSALDSQSEWEVQRAIDSIMKKQTTFIIAHRFSTITKVDRIMVLDKGKLVDFGTHGELMDRSDIYRSLYNIQFRKQRQHA